MLGVSALWLVIGVISLVFVFCLTATLIISKKLKEGKEKLKAGWGKYRKNNKWFARLFFADRLKEGYEQLLTGEKLYNKFLRIRRWLIIVLILTAFIDFGLIGLALLVK